MAVRRRTRLSAAGIAVLGLLLGVPGPAGADEVPAHELKAVIGTLAALDRELRALYERAALLDADDAHSPPWRAGSTRCSRPSGTSWIGGWP